MDFKLHCPTCNRRRAYARFPTSHKTETGREEICTGCKNGIEPVTHKRVCPICRREE